MTGAPSPKSGFWRMAIVVGTVLLAGLALGGFLYAKFFLPEELRVRDSDKLVLVTVRDLESSLGRFVPRTDSELLKKIRHADGRVELRYEYLHPGLDRTLYVLSVAEVYPTPKSARDAYARRVARELPESPYEGTEISSVNYKIPWADSARLAVLSQNGKPRGHAFLCRQDDRLLCIEIFGLHFEDDERFQDLVFSRLDELENYRP